MLRFSVLGHPVAHSLSPAMHRHALESLGLRGSYEALDTPLEALPRRLEEVRRDFRGVNLTIPLKEAALGLLDWVSPEARAIGAVNTVLNLQGRLFGFNTPHLRLRLPGAEVLGSKPAHRHGEGL